MQRCSAIAASVRSKPPAGWLQSLSKGAYLLAGDRPTRDGILAYLSRRVAGLHIGGKTALDWQGVRHNVSFRAARQSR
ncbi:AbiEi antitoxin N-terminal domain-containing protein [Paraburkholderia sp. LEh10]|uniref:AbiEi antitoxin N-terminal domain-containing protein n=1 Tax=Paraburkholderia sp. LEh10 TaxID=2821353 RepID=UPI0028ACCACD|nr:AbiEi antitoxin N-terminal domain-containing protein [Paraburkholderia sp. LEh10]